MKPTRTRPRSALPAASPAEPGLSAADRALVLRALQAARHSYSPYSSFRVGAAVRMASGRVYTGCNVENASYGLTVCAERVAIQSAVAAGERQVRAIAIVGGHGTPARPCGACLQVLAEFARADVRVLLAAPGALQRVDLLTLGALMPQAFALRVGSHRPTRRSRPKERRRS